MGLTVTVSGPERLADMEFTSEDLMREIGLLARERILRRTVSGQDMHDAPFAPYSPAYAVRKAAEVGGGGAVNLQLSGAMLNALTIVDVTKNRVTLGFSS